MSLTLLSICAKMMAHVEAKTNRFEAIPNCADFIIKKEDHTIGNLVSEQLKKHRNVLMAGYKGNLFECHHCEVPPVMTIKL